MQQPKPDFLAARLGVTNQNQRSLPHGWEIPEDEWPMEPRSSFGAGVMTAVMTVLLTLEQSVRTWLGRAS